MRRARCTGGKVLALRSAFRNMIKNLPSVKLAAAKLINSLKRVLFAEVTFFIVAHIICVRGARLVLLNYITNPSVTFYNNKAQKNILKRSDVQNCAVRLAKFKRTQRVSGMNFGF